jgi:hypothetical protein
MNDKGPRDFSPRPFAYLAVQRSRYFFATVFAPVLGFDDVLPLVVDLVDAALLDVVRPRSARTASSWPG